MAIMVINRLQKFIQVTQFDFDNMTTYSVYLKDVDMSFHFETEKEVQDFLNKQATERFSAKELRKGYFDYVNEHKETHRFLIKDLYAGKIVEFEEVMVTQHQ